MSGKNLGVVLLDWEKLLTVLNTLVFRKHPQVGSSITTFWYMIRDIYRPKFCASCDEGRSHFLIQETGIRQGCQLSPHFLILSFMSLMSVMFPDGKSCLHTPKQLEPIPGIYFSEILYADDTLIIFEISDASINKLLKAIELESTQYAPNITSLILLRESSIKSGTPGSV